MTSVDICLVVNLWLKAGEHRRLEASSAELGGSSDKFTEENFEDRSGKQQKCRCACIVW